MPPEKEPFRASSDVSGQAAPAWWPPALLFTSIVLLGLAGLARWGTILITLELLTAAAVVGPCILLGSTLVPLFRLGRIPFPLHLLFSSALGVGFVALLVLGAGAVGWLSRPVFVTVLGIGAVLGGVHLRHVWRERESKQQVARATSPALESKLIRWAWVMPCPFLVLALCAAGTAPGLIWEEEGFGYDVLEYHLQVPKEYLDAGRIDYLPHNIYASFPSNAEMLYLLSMLLLQETQEAAVTANFIHLLLGALSVYAGWAVARSWGRLAGLVTAALLGTSGWLVYLSGLAYVEHGLLFFGLAATGAALRNFAVRTSTARGGEEPLSGAETGNRAGVHAANWTLLAGVLAGLACGCKYTAVPFVAAPLGLMVLLAPAQGMTRRGANVLIFFVGVGMSFSPWLIKNAIHTGNPLFPLANGIWHAWPSGWDAEAQALWDVGHGVVEEMSVGERLSALWRHIPADKYGRFPWVAILLGILALWQRRIASADVALGVFLLLQVVVWLFGTHLFARFAVPMLIPLVLLSGRFVRGTRPMRAQRVRIGALAIGAIFHLTAMGRLFYAEWPGVVPPSVLVRGDVPGRQCMAQANREPAGGGRLALLGEARAFYFTETVDYWTTFNHNPIYARLLRSNSQTGVGDANTADDNAAFVQWLASRGYSHIYIDWSEVRRLARTYGSNPPMSDQELHRLIAPFRGAGLRVVCTVPDPVGSDSEGLPMVELFAIEP